MVSNKQVDNNNLNTSKSVIFFGTPKIAASCLQALLDAKINVISVVTKPDSFIGRKKEVYQSEVKQLALSNGIPVLQPNKVNEILNNIKQLNPDLIVVCAYGKIISTDILNIPKFHCINVHTSLLPRWRGGAPIHHAILAGDDETGISLMYMTKELDSGNIIYQEKININKDETYKTLYDKLCDLSYKVLTNKIHSLFSENVSSIKQDETKVTIARNISREDERINWNNSVSQIDCHVRGLYDNPIAYTIYNGVDVKIYQVELTKANSTNEPGTINDINKDGIVVSTKDYDIKIIKLQLPGKKPMYVKDLVNGHHSFIVNSKFS